MLFEINSEVTSYTAIDAAPIVAAYAYTTLAVSLGAYTLERNFGRNTEGDVRTVDAVNEAFDAVRKKYEGA